MRTVRCSSRLLGGGVLPGEECLPGHPSSVHRMTDACENITLPQLSLGRQPLPGRHPHPGQTLPIWVIYCVYILAQKRSNAGGMHPTGMLFLFTILGNAKNLRLESDSSKLGILQMTSRTKLRRAFQDFETNSSKANGASRISRRIIFMKTAKKMKTFEPGRGERGGVGNHASKIGLTLHWVRRKIMGPFEWHMHFYRPQRSCEGYVFTPQYMLGYHSPPSGAEPPRSRHPPRPRAGSPRTRHPRPLSRRLLLFYLAQWPQDGRGTRSVILRSWILRH